MGGACEALPVSSCRVARARKVSPSAEISLPSVRVVVNGRSLLLPEHVLNDALDPLARSTEGYVSREDYASSVALVLAALERLGVVIVATN